MRLLITGALGHIGSRLIHSLQPGEFEKVVLLDDLSTQRYCTLFNLPAGTPFHFVEADVRRADLKSLFQGIDVVIHLAAITDAAGSFDIPEQVEEVNFQATQRVAQACLEEGCSLLFLSTTSVYGSQDQVVDEDCSLADLQPQSPYAESKLRAEQFLAELTSREGLRSVVLRLGTICGTSAGMRFHTAVNKFCWQACLGQPLSVWKTALHQKRPYLELGDAVRAFRFVLEKGLFDGRLYNFVTQNATVNDIIQLLREEVPDVQVSLVDAKIMNQLSYEVRCERIQGLGFRFSGSLRDAVKETVELLRNAGGQRFGKALSSVDTHS